MAIEAPNSLYAESILYKSWDCDIIGMTNTRNKIGKEAEMGYISIGMVTDYDCGIKIMMLLRLIKL